MQYNFDQIIDRRNTHSLKWDECENFCEISTNDGLAMWVADMDFMPPQPVNIALLDATTHGIHGYFGNESDYRQSVLTWMKCHHDWEIKPEWILLASGVLSAISLAIRAITKENDGIILFTPVYHGLAKTILANNRQVVSSQMTMKSGKYQMDLDSLANQLKGHERAVILCSPHNPGGRVWTQGELRTLGQFCLDHNLYLLSDEIHHDLVFHNHRHHVIANLMPELEQQVITLTSASKTFNIAGAMTGNAIISNEDIRSKFKKAQTAAGFWPNRLGMIMSTAAYKEGAEWLNQLMIYLDENRKYLDAEIKRIPGLSSTKLESTYLAWINFSKTGLKASEFSEHMKKVAKIAVSQGADFGSGGNEFFRLNFATPRTLMDRAIENLHVAFSDSM